MRRRAVTSRTGRPSVVTTGPRGAVAYDGTLHRAVTEAVDVADPTGAGDVFDAGFVHGLATGRGIEGCMALGCAAAGLFLQAAQDARPRERFAGRDAVEERAGGG